jgi:flagellin-like hook-associated protein FlgL
MSSMFGTIDFLNRNVAHKSLLNNKSVRKIAGAGDPVKTLAEEQGSGGVSFAANLQNLNKYKRGSINAFQNALSMMQMQSEGLRQAEKIYNRMLSVAQMAADPSAGSDTRSLLAEEFADLREQSIAINAMTVNGKDLFDARAASTQYSIDFTGGLQSSVTESGGMKSDGTFVANAQYEGIPGGTNGGTQHPYWEVTEDVIYNNGKLTLDFKPYTAWDRIMVFQEDQYSPLFDTKDWQANDYDRFTIRYGPKRNTTFEFSDSEHNAGNHFGNKNYYLSKFGLTDDGTTTGMENYYAKELTGLGQVETNESIDSSQITVRVIGKAWRQTGYDVKATWETLSLPDSVAGRSGDMQVNLNQMGLGYLRQNTAGFPTISVGTTADALNAIDLLRTEIENLGDQNGKLGSNFNRVEIAMDAAQKQLMTQEKALSQVGGTDLTADLIELSKTRIERHQNAALMTQAMSIHKDLVDVLI